MRLMNTTSWIRPSRPSRRSRQLVWHSWQYRWYDQHTARLRWCAMNHIHNHTLSRLNPGTNKMLIKRVASIMRGTALDCVITLSATSCPSKDSAIWPPRAYVIAAPAPIALATVATLSAWHGAAMSRLSGARQVFCKLHARRLFFSVN